ncbi:YlcI/YnfO family protein [Vibrio renipiscarius]|uniref:YlcI/YnfO family protein n=1 Tax=Vibrio renipiscarius TaxID=1461322 RepID=UPI001269B3E3
MKKIIIKINANTNAISAKKNIRFEHELIDEINDIKSKNQSFSSWVKQACREKLRRDERLCAQDRSQPDRFVPS